MIRAEGAAAANQALDALAAALKRAVSGALEDEASALGDEAEVTGDTVETVVNSDLPDAAKAEITKRIKNAVRGALEGNRP